MPFTPAAEAPTCGHATIAAMYALALEEDLSSCILKMKTRIGLLPFEIQRSEGRIRVWMTQGEIGCNGCFVFVLDFDDPMALSHGRMFAPAIGIDEDPVTGNANGPLGAYLVHHGLAAVKNNCFFFSGIQGGDGSLRGGVLPGSVRRLPTPGDS